MKSCGHVSSHDFKKQVGSYFVMRAGLRNNEVCLCGFILLQFFGTTTKYKNLLKHTYTY